MHHFLDLSFYFYNYISFYVLKLALSLIYFSSYFLIPYSVIVINFFGGSFKQKDFAVWPKCKSWKSIYYLIYYSFYLYPDTYA